jgi:hypothetical protein
MRRRPTPGVPRREIAIRGSRRSSLSSGLLLSAVASVLALVAAGCGSSGTTSTAAPATATAAPTTTTSKPATTSTPAATSASTTPASSGLSGTWSGEYSGAYSGTFILNWTQSGSSLNGKIKISAPPSTLKLNGTLAGSTIRFGTVGSLAITYSGSVSGSSMSGNYTVGGAAGGPWKASKTG